MSLEKAEAEAAAVGKAPRVTLEHIQSRVKDLAYYRHGTLTICILTVDNGFKVVGQSAAASPENFNEELGRKFAKEDAMRHLWRLEGYLLCERQMST